jgi:quinol monooxygenase YgiN
MIVRLVKMTFRADEVERFQELFDGWRPRIIASAGCLGLELLRDIRKPDIFFTHSTWNSLEDIEAYRNSTTFADVWPVVKRLFAEPAQAWSLQGEHGTANTTNKIRSA